MDPMTPLNSAASLSGMARDTESAEAITRARRDGELRRACREFESVLLEQVLKDMRRSIPKSGVMDGGFQGQMYTGMMDHEVARQAALGKGVGLGEMLYQAVSRRMRLEDAGVIQARPVDRGDP